MNRIGTKEKVSQRRRSVRSRPVRIGRPPQQRAGEVDTRILDAARRVFIERGLAGASIDEIARLASAGKPTLYARFASKEALFTAVVMRNVALKIAHFESHAPSGATIEEVLVSAGFNFLGWALVDDTVDLMRLGIAEARRFPDLASRVHGMARERAEQAIARLLGESAQSDELGRLPAFAPERLAATARLFVDLVIMPLLMRGLFGEKLKLLRTQIAPHVTRSVAFFLAACRHGGVT